MYLQDGVNQLSDVEKLLLYLKLPTGSALGYHKEFVFYLVDKIRFVLVEKLEPGKSFVLISLLIYFIWKMPKDFKTRLFSNARALSERRLECWRITFSSYVRNLNKMKINDGTESCY